jgi:hypothetical protein
MREPGEKAIALEHFTACASFLSARSYSQKQVRYFWSRQIPPTDAILLVESGSRTVLERVIPHLRDTWGEETNLDLVTCYSQQPAGLPVGRSRIFRTHDYRGRTGRAQLYRELDRNRYRLMGIVCSGEPIMTKWKWALAAHVAAKIFVINENGDYFWLDRGHTRPLREFAMERAGLAGAGAVRTLARVFSFPFTILFLLAYAAAVHCRRALRG